MFGRHVSADVLLDHESVSRRHAALCFQGMTGKCMVLDLNSAHGTFVDGRRVDKVGGGGHERGRGYGGTRVWRGCGGTRVWREGMVV